MDRFHERDALLYKVLMDRDAKFSVWPASRTIPVGWKEAGVTALKSECFAYIKSIWKTRPPRIKRKIDG